MARHKIYCIVNNNSREKIITHVGIRGLIITSVPDVIKMMRKGEKFITRKNGRSADVYSKRSPRGRKFLTTDPDDTRDNNLDFLPFCR
jgi:hypothetical protein